ncbi:uncharacterized protein ACIBXB_000872 isoform 2-T2 [Morphnus guianensis]
MEHGNTMRTAATTTMNATSSRSHVVVTIQFEQTHHCLLAPPRQRADESMLGCLTPGCRASLASPPFWRLHAVRHCCSRSGDRRRQRCPKPLPACSCCLPVSALQNSWARYNKQPYSEQAHRARHKRGAGCGTSPAPGKGRPQRGGGKDVTPEGHRGPNPAVLAVCAPGQGEGCWVTVVLLLTGG